MNSLDNQEDIINNFPEPITFSQNLEKLQSQLSPLLDEFQKYYVFLNKNPDYPEYQNMFQNVKSNLNNINSQLFSLSNDVQSNTDKLNSKLFVMDILIQRERIKNRELKRKLGIVEHKNNAASELISDYKNIYESGYLRNWALFLSILFAGITISKVFKSQNLA
jgi:hypothetical protein